MSKIDETLDKHNDILFHFRLPASTSVTFPEFNLDEFSSSCLNSSSASTKPDEKMSSSISMPTIQPIKPPPANPISFDVK